MSVSITRTAVVIVVENDGARILKHHLIAKLLAVRGDTRAKLMDKATCFTLAVADSSILVGITIEWGTLVPISISLSHACQTVVKCLL